MKNFITVCCFLFTVLLASAQEMREQIPRATKAEIDAKLVVYGKQLAVMRQWLQRRNESAETGAAGSSGAADNHILFGWPMRVNSNYDHVPSYYVISNYMDVNRDLPGNNPANRRDWYCGKLNYRFHEGHDYSSYPFFWRMMENNNVFASAAHSGLVIDVVDNINNSYNCMRDSLENNAGNHITILNSDSSISQYYHIRTGSAKVAEGQFVEQGKILANIASSGHTSNPHLHFDLQYYRPETGIYNFVEPSKKAVDTGTYRCNPTSESTWWQNPKTYLEPKLNRVMTHSSIPKLMGSINGGSGVGFCYEEEDAKAKNQFNPGEVAIVGIALTHVSVYDSMFIRIYFPNGNPWTSTPVPNPSNNWEREMYITRGFLIPANAPAGTYTIQVDFTYRPFDPVWVNQPQTAPITKSYRHFFTVGCTASQTIGNVAFNFESGYIVGNDLHSAAIITGKHLYQAGNYIQLTPGFNAKAGCDLKARINDCNYSE